MQGDDGREYVFLLKGHEDLRQDERVMQLFGQVSPPEQDHGRGRILAISFEIHLFISHRALSSSFLIPISLCSVFDFTYASFKWGGLHTKRGVTGRGLSSFFYFPLFAWISA